MRKVCVSLIVALVCTSSFLAYNHFRIYEEIRFLQGEKIAVDISPGRADTAFMHRLAPLRGRQLIEQIVGAYRSQFPDSAVSDEELVLTLVDSTMEIMRHSQRVVITVRSHNEKLAADLADTYAAVCEENSCSQTNESFTGPATVYKWVEEQ